MKQLAISIYRKLRHKFGSRNLVMTSKGRNSMLSSQKHQNFDFLLVLDFEATCQNNNDKFIQEIIEFPVLKVNSQTMQIEATFHQYVSPVVNPMLSDYCIELTGIIPQMLVGQPTLLETLKKFDNWMREQSLLESRFIFVTSGDWDLKTMLPSNCLHHEIDVPEYMKQWINVKSQFCQTTGIWPRGINGMIRHFNMKFQGRPHSGIDDCKNIVNIMRCLSRQGCIFKETSRL